MYVNSNDNMYDPGIVQIHVPNINTRVWVCLEYITNPCGRPVVRVLEIHQGFPSFFHNINARDKHLRELC